MLVACGSEPPAPDESVDLRWQDAPLRIEPGAAEGPDPVIVIPDAVIEDVGSGWLVLYGATIEAEAGAIASRDFEWTEPGRLRLLADPADVPELPPALEGDPTLMALDAREVLVDGLIVTDFDGAELFGTDIVPLSEPFVVSATAVLWDDEATRLVFTDNDGEPAPETAHAASLGGGMLGWNPGDGQPLAEGDPCTESASCDGDLICVDDLDDEIDSGVCALQCVPTTSLELGLCTDDASCCEDAAVCDDEGLCQPAGDGDGGDAGTTDPSQEGGINEGCGDNDSDGVCNAIDEKPDESCSADADDDGCKDSCDANDTDSGDGCGGGSGGFCRYPRVRRPNSTFWALLLLVLLRGRNRYRAPGPRFEDISP